MAGPGEAKTAASAPSGAVARGRCQVEDPSLPQDLQKQLE